MELEGLFWGERVGWWDGGECYGRDGVYAISAGGGGDVGVEPGAGAADGGGDAVDGAAAERGATATGAVVWVAGVRGVRGGKGGVEGVGGGVSADLGFVGIADMNKQQLENKLAEAWRKSARLRIAIMRVVGRDPYDWPPSDDVLISELGRLTSPPPDGRAGGSCRYER